MKKRTHNNQSHFNVPFILGTIIILILFSIAMNKKNTPSPFASATTYNYDPSYSYTITHPTNPGTDPAPYNYTYTSPSGDGIGSFPYLYQQPIINPTPTTQTTPQTIKTPSTQQPITPQYQPPTFTLDPQLLYGNDTTQRESPALNDAWAFAFPETVQNIAPTRANVAPLPTQNLPPQENEQTQVLNLTYVTENTRSIKKTLLLVLDGVETMRYIIEGLLEES